MPNASPAITIACERNTAQSVKAVMAFRINSVGEAANVVT